MTIVGTVLFVGGPLLWFATPFPTEAAHHAWNRWHAAPLALALDRTDAVLAMEIGNGYFGSVPLGGGEPAYNPSLAARAFRRALAIDPGILWGHYELARIAFIKGDFGGALRNINAELATNPENLRSLYVRGLIYGYRGKPGDLALAESDFRRFTQWAPTEWAGYNDLSWILEREGKYGNVESVMQVAFSAVPGGRENPWLWNELGVAQLNVGERAAARISLTHAMSAAGALTEADWRRAYSGDSPTGDAEGLAVFKAGIQANLALAGQ